MKEYTSYRISERLKYVGFEAAHSMDYVRRFAGDIVLEVAKPICDISEAYTKRVPAYTFLELWDVLPETFELEEYNWVKLQMVKRFCHKTYTTIGYVNYKPIQSIYVKSYADNWNVNIAGCAGSLVEWLIENKYIKASHI